MKAETALWWLATGCAFLLLFAPFTPRTRWTPSGRNSGGLSQITEGVGVLGIAGLLGGAALLGLIVGLKARQRVSTAGVGAAVATIAFCITGVGMARYWIDLINRVTSVQPGPGWVLHPAPLVPFFTILAAAGAGSTLALLISWRIP